MSNSKIYLGSTNLGTGKIRLGANDVSAIYLGTSLIYPPQPTVNCHDDWASLGYMSEAECECVESGDNMGYESKGDCMCNEFQECINCSSEWQTLGFQSEAECECQMYEHCISVSPSTLNFDNSNLTATFTVTSDESWTLTDNCNGTKYVLYDHTLNCSSFHASYDGSYDWHAPEHPVGDGTDSIWMEWKTQSPQVVSKQEYIDGCAAYGITVSGLNCDSSGYYLELRPTTGRKWLTYSTTSGAAGTTIVTVTCGLSEYPMSATITISTAHTSATIDVYKNVLNS